MASDSSVIFGFHAVNGLLTKHPGKIARILYLDQRQDGRIKGLLRSAQMARIDCSCVSKMEFDKHIGSPGSVAHQSVLALIRQDRICNESDLDNLLGQVDDQSIFLLLDNITDPHNLGACLRSANAAGVSAVIVPKDRSAPLNSAARKVACGAADITPVIRVTNLARTIKHMQSYGVWMVGAAGEAQHVVYDVKLSGPLALVMGAEEKGLRRLTRENCDLLVKIPLLGEVSSLNVSVATGIFLFEALRQRR
jgi:23S rRNA (guanosine2251-2'-O)-methyltransferase